MKRAIKMMCFCLMAMMLLAGCSEAESEQPQASCLCDVNIQWSVSNKLATVQYNKKLQKWYLARPEIQQDEYYHEYYPKSLAKAFRKEGLKVRFSGDVYPMSIDGDATTTDAEGGQRLNRCCLDLLTISETTSLAPIEGEWHLDGWMYQGKWWQVDPYIVGGYKFLLKVIPDYEEIYANALDGCEAIFQRVTLVDDKIYFDACMYSKGSSIIEDVQFFGEHIGQIKSYQKVGTQLKLFFGDSDYFLFYYGDNSTKPFSDDRWFEGPDYPYVGDVTEVDNGNGVATMKILEVPVYPTTGTYSSVYLRHPGAQSICHFKLSEWEKVLSPGDRLFCYITRFQQTDDNEPNRTFNCELKPYQETTLIENRRGYVSYEEHRGWYILQDYPKIRFFPMKPMAEEFLKVGTSVVFSGYRYDVKEPSDSYIELTSLKRQ